MASYRKLKTGWKATISKRVNGKLKQISKNGFATKNEARLWAVSVEAEDNLTTIKAGKDISFKDYFESWYQTYKAPKLALITIDRYRNITKLIGREFTDMTLSDITRKDYQRFINRYGANHAKDTVYKVNSILRACVKSALLDELLTKDFTEGIELVYNVDNNVNVEYLEANELKALTKATVDKLDPRYTSYYMILTAIYTGMRIGEVMALTWKDIDFKNHTISINKSWDYVHRTGFKPTKTDSSNRTIGVSEKLLNHLKELKVNESDMIFRNESGTIPSSSGVNKSLRKLLDECGLVKQNFHFHSLRHTHVAYLLANNIDLYVISKRLGHADMTITARKYAYLLDSHSKSVEEQINKAVSLLS